MFATLTEGKEGQVDDNGEPVWWLNVKCDPDEALLLRDKYESGYPVITWTSDQGILSF